MTKTLSSTILNSKAYAKVNLGLAILGKAGNDYHLVETIYQPIDFYDQLTFKLGNNPNILISTSNPSVPTNEKNLIYQAAELIKNKHSSIQAGMTIKLKKNIPMGAGLGGGSSNAAITLLALNKLWQLKLTTKQLISLATQLGADVASFLSLNTKLETQGGNQAGQFQSLPSLPSCFMILCFPEIEISSQQAYSQVTSYSPSNKLQQLVAALKKQSLEQICQQLYNDFEPWLLKTYPPIKTIKQTMLKHGALNAIPSGKGSTVFGIFNNLTKAKQCQQLLLKNYQQTFLTKPIIDKLQG